MQALFPHLVDDLKKGEMRALVIGFDDDVEEVGYDDAAPSIKVELTFKNVGKDGFISTPNQTAVHLLYRLGADINKDAEKKYRLVLYPAGRYVSDTVIRSSMRPDNMEDFKIFFVARVFECGGKDKSSPDKPIGRLDEVGQEDAEVPTPTPTHTDVPGDTDDDDDDDGSELQAEDEDDHETDDSDDPLKQPPPPSALEEKKKNKASRLKGMTAEASLQKPARIPKRVQDMSPVKSAVRGAESPHSDKRVRFDDEAGPSSHPLPTAKRTFPLDKLVDLDRVLERAGMPKKHIATLEHAIIFAKEDLGGFVDFLLMKVTTLNPPDLSAWMSVFVHEMPSGAFLAMPIPAKQVESMDRKLVAFGFPSESIAAIEAGLLYKMDEDARKFVLMKLEQEGDDDEWFRSFAASMIK